MAHLNINVLQEDLNKTFGDWSITWGDEENPKNLNFKYWLRADSETRTAYSDLALFMSRLYTGSLSVAEEESVAESGKDVYDYITERIVKVMRSLSESAEEFNAFFESVGLDFALWQKILNTYHEHYDLSSGEATPSQNS